MGIVAGAGEGWVEEISMEEGIPAKPAKTLRSSSGSDFMSPCRSLETFR